MIKGILMRNSDWVLLLLCFDDSVLEEVETDQASRDVVEWMIRWLEKVQEQAANNARLEQEQRDRAKRDAKLARLEAEFMTLKASLAANANAAVVLEATNAKQEMVAICGEIDECLV